QRIFDVGCGNGLFFELLKNKKVDYLGVDSSKKLILEARKKYPKAKFFIGDALNLKFSKNNFNSPWRRFDLIFSFAFLHHLPGEKMRQDFLKNIYRLLKPQGYFICTCWNSFAGRKMKYIRKYNKLWRQGKSKLDYNDSLVPWKDAKGKILAEIYYHRFGQAEIKKLFESVGFKIVELFYEKNGKKSDVKKADNLCVVGKV
ncbi:MAG: class I SAM-dependent methyltransferase, partial [Patescibacteria group bacterium]